MMSTISHGVDPKWDALQDLLKVVTDASETRNRIQQMADAIAGMAKAKSELDAAKSAHAEREAAINQRSAELNQRESDLKLCAAAAASKAAEAASTLAAVTQRNAGLDAKEAALKEADAVKQREWQAGDLALAQRIAATGRLEAQLHDEREQVKAREATAAATVADYNARLQRLREAAQ